MKAINGNQAAFPFYADDKKSVVYMATNTVNGKRYVGVTRRTLSIRCKQHGIRAKSGMRGKFYSAIRKYGFDAFKFKIIQKCPTYKIALRAEAEWIANERPEYNLTNGGEGVTGHRHSSETREKMRAAAQARGGRGPWEKGHCPDAVRAKLSASAKRRKGEKASPAVAAMRREVCKMMNERRRKKIVCLTDGRTFESVAAASAAYSMSNGLVSWYCKQGRIVRRRDGTMQGFAKL